MGHSIEASISKNGGGGDAGKGRVLVTHVGVESGHGVPGERRPTWEGTRAVWGYRNWRLPAGQPTG